MIFSHVPAASLSKLSKRKSIPLSNSVKRETPSCLCSSSASSIFWSPLTLYWRSMKLCWRLSTFFSCSCHQVAWERREIQRPGSWSKRRVAIFPFPECALFWTGTGRSDHRTCLPSGFVPFGFPASRPTVEIWIIIFY